MINLLSQTNIDKTRWDACVRNSTSGEIYGFSWWLDAVSPLWGAAIYGDYELILPIPIKKRYGLAYLMRPNNTPCLSFYGPLAGDRQLEAAMLAKVLKRHHNGIWGLRSHLDPKTITAMGSSISEGACQCLDLNKPYSSLRESYHPSIIKNLNKGIRLGQHCSAITLSEAQDLIYAHWTAIGFGTASHLDSFSQVLIAAEREGCVRSFGVRNEAQTLIAAGLFFQGIDRLHLFTALTAEGRQTKAGYTLFDSAIAQYADRALYLDFGGSALPGVAAYNKLWGAYEIPYQMLEHLWLPFRWWSCLKKWRQRN